MTEKRKPGPSMIRTAIGYITKHGGVVLPTEWDGEYVVAEMNKWLRTNFLRGKLVEHSSLGMEGIVGAKVQIVILRPLDDEALPRTPNSAGGKGRNRKV